GADAHRAIHHLDMRAQVKRKIFYRERQRKSGARFQRERILGAIQLARQRLDELLQRKSALVVHCKSPSPMINFKRPRFSSKTVSQRQRGTSARNSKPLPDCCMRTSSGRSILASVTRMPVASGGITASTTSTSVCHSCLLMGYLP